MKAVLQLKMGQSLAMTPQLQQAIRLLQLSSLELHTEIQQVLESNPLLEREENASLDEERPQDVPAETNQDEEAPHVSATELTDLDSANIPVDLPTDSQWEDTYTSLPSTPTAPAATSTIQFEDEDNSNDSLQAHLRWQMELTPFSPHELHIAAALIDSIDEAGYLSSELTDIQQGLPLRDEDETTELDEIEAVLHRIQHFDPLGVGARNLSECLLIQLQHYPSDTPQIDLLRQLVEHHLEDIAKHEHTAIKRSLKIKDDTLAELVAMIQLLNPRPGNQVEATQTEYITPDIYATKVEDRWQLSLNPDTAPKLGIADHYVQLISQDKNSADNAYLKSNLQEARWFLKSLESRNDTLLKVTAAIIKRQHRFLEQGDEAMQPLVLHEIADEVEMHESTISRVTTRKYLHTPRGIFELKYFFSSHVDTDDGAGCSATAIRAMIKILISEENLKKPLSDNKITDMLQAKGIQVARRTVAKYREALNIPSSSQRKRLF